MRIDLKMGRFKAATRRVTSDASGSVSMEYGLVATLISVAIIGALSATGTGVADKWNAFAGTIVSHLR